MQGSVAIQRQSNISTQIINYHNFFSGTIAAIYELIVAVMKKVLTCQCYFSTIEKYVHLRYFLQTFDKKLTNILKFIS